MDKTEKKEKILEEQTRVLENDKKNMLVSASAGSGKTHIMIKYICALVIKKHVPIKDFLVLTFTKSAAAQMKDKLSKRLKEACENVEEQETQYIFDQIDALSTANICTIDAFCERAIKKYANILGINDSFSVLDENEAIALKKMCFQNSLKRFSEKHFDDFALIADAYKHDETKIWEIIKKLEDISNSVADKDAFLQDLSQNFEQKFDLASDFLYKDFLNTITKGLQELESLHVEKYYADVSKLFEAALSSKNLFEVYDNLQNVKKMPTRPYVKVVGEEIFQQIGEIKDAIWGKTSKIKNLCLSNQENILSQRCGELEKAMLKFFDAYEKQYNSLKKAQNCMDFADLEKFMKVLSENEKLFENFQYVFVDEYQDTNKKQEEIIKNIAKNCNFVAVGDLKQGIYGFRLASSEIFLKDLKNFEKDEYSAVNYLKSNFRSNQKVLDFVNEIFKVCMTEQTSNVDYFSTSMLKSENDFADEEAKAINIDLVAKQKPDFDEIPKVYSVLNAKILSENSNLLMLKDVKRRINEVVGSKISDDGSLRTANYGDIAILARKRDAFFEQLETYLQENGIPVISNSRSKLAQEPEIQMLVNYLRLALAVDNEVALLSVLLSGLYLLDIQKILDEKIEKQKNLVEVVLENQSGLFTKFLQNLDEFRLNYEVFGAKKAFLTLFAQTNYFSYLNLRKDKERTGMFVKKFLEEIEKNEFDIPALVNYFDTVDIVVTPEASDFGDCVTLTTIHDSKGLEYPIVFLIGCDNDFSGNQSGDVQINEHFGLALKVYDFEENSATPSVRLLAIQEDERKEDFVEELKIFYVALTRAKNRLYLFGNFDEQNFSKHDIKSCKTYFDLIFLALKSESAKFCANGFFENKTLSINLIEDVEEVPCKIEQNLENAEFDEKIVEKIDKYLDFSYKFGERENFRLKESVTGLTKKIEPEGLENFSNENFNFAGEAIETGNAYHLALKVVNFENVFDLQSLRKELQNVDEQSRKLVDEEILLKNVMILKELTKGGHIFKEKEFLLKEKLKELVAGDADDEILVQGIVDLFAVKEDKIVLVDFKYSSKSERYLIDKYKNQLKLYKIAIENAFNRPVSGCFLLSLKFAKIIPISF